jgi:two-component system CheB/CheR fusion protein
VLHDDLQQFLVAARLHLSILKQDGVGTSLSTVSKIEQLLDQCLSTARSLSTELNPRILQEEGLTAGLHWLAGWMKETHGLTVELLMETTPPELPEDVKVLLFESIRELLFNAVKHAGVPSVVVNARLVDEKELHLTVSDSGRGFAPAARDPAGQKGGGLGHLRIRDRLDFIGGSMEIDSAKGLGSRITLIAPVARPTSAC